MLRKPIGVWFSIALVILILGAGLGWKLGQRLAVYRFRYQREAAAKLPASERPHVEAVFSALTTVTVSRLYAGITTPNPSFRTKALQSEIATLNRARQRPDLQDVEPIFDLNLAIAYVRLAEEESETQQAAQAMQSAHALFRSLGWKDDSDDALRAAAKRELDFWNPDFTKKAPPK
jgi:hypothetical protein